MKLSCRFLEKKNSAYCPTISSGLLNLSSKDSLLKSTESPYAAEPR